MRVVVPSVNYADFLEVTLPAWRAVLPISTVVSLVVVTTPEDQKTQEVAVRHGAGLVVTKAWRVEDGKFDKAAALDVAFGFSGNRMPRPSIGERCLSIDADVYPFGVFPADRLRKDTIYGVPRYACGSMDELQAHIEGRMSLASLELITQRKRGLSDPPLAVNAPAAEVERAARACLGYFQLWRYTKQTFGSWKSAGGYDIAFRNSFPKRKALSGFYVLHLGPMSRRNWKGRVLPSWGAIA